MKKTVFISIFLLCGSFTWVNAQKGSSLMLWGGPQLTFIANFDDYNAYAIGPISSELSRVPTYRWGGGLTYIWNFSDFYGLQTGLYYSKQGQKYKGFIDRDINIRQDTSVNFNSHVYINYLRVPLAFRFNSQSDPQDVVTLSIFIGPQFGYLLGVQEIYTDPAPTHVIADVDGDDNYTDTFNVASLSSFNKDKLYKKLDVGFCAGAEFKIRISDRLGSVIGVRFDRSAGNIENLGVDLPDGAPAEWTFPISTKKIERTDLLVRNESKNNSINLYFGMLFNLTKQE